MSRRHPIIPPTNPGASGTAVIYDSLAVTSAGIRAGLASALRARFRTAVYIDKADATFKVEWAAPDSTNLRTVSSELIPINDYFQRDILLQPGRTKISIVTVTACTVWEVGGEAIDDQALGQ